MDYTAAPPANAQQQNVQQPYDPAQAQAYEAYYASYSQYHHHQPQQQYDAYQHYYPTDYSSSSAAAGGGAYHQPLPQPDPAPQPPPPATNPIPQQQSHGQYRPPGTEPQQPGYQAAAAAAVAAFSELTQFAGKMDAAERAMAGVHGRPWHGDGAGPMGPAAAHPYPHYPTYSQLHQMVPQLHGGPLIRPAVGGRPPIRGGGRRGGRSFRGGGGRGNSSSVPPRQDGAPPPFRGRGRGRRGRGAGRGFAPSAPDTQAARNEPGPVLDSLSASESSAAKTPAVAAVPKALLLPIAWCDICRVECSSLEILQQHNNGKRHKKTLQRYEEMQKRQKLMAELQANGTMLPEMASSKVEDQKVAQVRDAGLAIQAGAPVKVSVASEGIPSAVVDGQVGEVAKDPTGPKDVPVPVPVPALTVEQNSESEIQRQAVEGLAGAKEETVMKALTEPPSSDAPEAEGPPIDRGHMRRLRTDSFERFERGRGSKRKATMFGRGAKRLRNFEPVGKPFVRPREQPRFCTLCDVMCDTQAVFECHLSGKKHMTKLKRFQGQGVTYGPISVYIPPNQSTASQGPEPLFFGLRSQELLQQEANGLTSPQVESFGPRQSDKLGKTSEYQGGQSSEQEHPKSEVPVNLGEGGAALNPESLNAVTEFEAEEVGQGSENLEDRANLGQDGVALYPESANAATEFEAKETRKGSDAARLDESTLSMGEYVPRKAPECESSIGDNAIVPGLDVKMEEPSANNEE